MTKSNNWIIAAVACIFAILGIFAGIQKFALHTPQSNVVSELLAMSLVDAEGNTQALSQWKGKILLVNFWATWCAPCVQEIPELSELQLLAQQKNIQIIGLGIDSAANIQEFSRQHKISYPLYIADTSGVALSRKFGNQAGGLPFTVLISADGNIQKSYLGRLKLDDVKHDLHLD